MEKVININVLQSYLVTLIPTKKVRVREADDGIISLIPVEEPKPVNTVIDVAGFLERKRSGQLPECVSELFGMFADKGDTLDKFMERKHIDKRFDL